MYHIVIAEPIAAEGVALFEAAAEFTCTQIANPSRGDLLEQVKQADALIIRSKTVIDEALLDAAPGLKIVARAGMGLDNVDVHACTQRGIMVMNLPGVQVFAQAEHTIGLMLALARRIPEADSALRRGEWLHEALLGSELRDKALGIFGLGEVGRRVAGIAQALGMTVIASDPYVAEDRARKLQVLLVSPGELLARADYVSFHVPPTQQTRHMIGAEELAQMKPGAKLVNVSWGQIVDQDALCMALDEGHLGGAALDVFDEEPPENECLLAAPNLVMTPRLGNRTVEAVNRTGVQIAQQVIDALRETDFRNVVNMPFMGASGYDQLNQYLKLAETMGFLQARLFDHPVEFVEVECIGEALQEQVRAITVALLKGLLSESTDEAVNYINAPLIAHNRGIRLTQASGLIRPDYPTLVACRVHGGGEQQVIAGSVFGGVEQRILQIGDFRTELKPAGIVLYVRSIDIPGVIGYIGTLLGRHKINIAAMDNGRIEVGGAALTLITIDTLVSDEVIAQLVADEYVEDVRQIVFD
jgi:D-3-phosphoglycerate dehydrogenase